MDLDEKGASKREYRIAPMKNGKSHEMPMETLTPIDGEGMMVDLSSDETERAVPNELNKRDDDKPSTTIRSSTKSPETKPKVAGFRSLFHYPAAAYFCLGNEFSERFSFYGMKAILVIYLITAHGLSSTTAKLIYHLFVFTAYFAPLFGSMLADGFLGRYRVILFGSIVYCIGHVLLTLGGIPSLGSTIMRVLDYAGLVVIALATGGIKPCVSAFAADQFPSNMESERTQFFSFFYFMINCGALLSQIITPILRRQPCLGNETCFPLAFGVPAIFMFLATIIFWAGTRWYHRTPVRDNVIARVCRCVFYALKQKCRSQEKKTHWLDYASPKFDQMLIDDVKAMFDIMVLFMPVVLFWALFEQMGSTWVLQANAMNGRLGQLTILPDQMGVLNPFFVILLVPLFESVIYPTLAKCNILTRPLRRMGWGGFLAVISFIIAGFLQLAVDKTSIDSPASGRVIFKVSNFLNCDVYFVDVYSQKNLTVPANRRLISDELLPNLTIGGSAECGNWTPETTFPFSAPSTSDKAYFVPLFRSMHPKDPLPYMSYAWKKTPEGKTRVYFLFEPTNDPNSNLSMTVQQGDTTKGTVVYNSSQNGTQQVDVEPDLIGSNEYDIYFARCTNGNCSKKHLKKFEAITGAAHVFIFLADDTYRMELLIPPNSIPMFWQVPQFIIITIGEILFSISGLSFSYSQASPKMKSVFQAIWLLTVAAGNLLAVGLSGSGLFQDKAALEFFVYGSIMGVVMVLFVILAWRYKDKSKKVKENEKLLNSNLEKEQKG